MPPSNTGSFGNGQISPELKSAILRRGTQGGPMNAVTTGAPTYDQTQQPSQVQLGPSSNPPISPTSVGVQPPQGQGLPVGSSEAEIILKSLAGRLKMLPV